MRNGIIEEIVQPTASASPGRLRTAPRTRPSRLLVTIVSLTKITFVGIKQHINKIMRTGGCFDAYTANTPFPKAQQQCANANGIIAVDHDGAKGEFLAKGEFSSFLPSHVSKAT